MKTEDFDNDMGALFEEDSVLAQAVVNLQNRRKKISSEETKSEDEISSEKGSSTKAISDASPNAAEASVETVEPASAHSKNGAPDLSAEIEAAENDDADLSLFEAEALAVDPSDVIPYTDKNVTTEQSESKSKKPKLFGRKKKTAATEPIKLLEFVVNENTSTQKSEEVLPQQVATVETAVDENDKSNDVHSSDATDITDENNSSEQGSNAILPEPDEEAAIPETAETANEDDGESEAAPHDDTNGIISTAPLSLDENSTVFVTQFEEPSHDVEDDGKAEDTSDDKAPGESEENEHEDSEPEAEEPFCDEEIPENESQSENGTKKKIEKSRFIDGVFDFVELFIFSLAAVLLITTFFFRHSVVEGGSMEETLFDGEHIIISKLFYEPERGDIIVCEDYSTELRKPIVKRIIGLPGDTVEFINAGLKSKVLVNGEELDEDYIHIDGFDFTPSGKWVVGEGEVFVMGDHRNNSTDSRLIGTVRIDSIIGKALIRFYPFDKFGKIE